MQGISAIYFRRLRKMISAMTLSSRYLAQMSEYFKEDGLQALARRAAEVASAVEPRECLVRFEPFDWANV